MSIFDKLTESLDIENVSITPVEVVDAEPITTTIGDTSINTNLDVDYVRTRSNLHALSEKLNGLIDNAIDVAQASETPRAYEVAGGLVREAVELNLSLIKLANEVKKVKGLNGGNTNNTTNNSIFVGSTAQLLKFINKKSDI
jgi:hypothetical protein